MGVAHWHPCMWDYPKDAAHCERHHALGSGFEFYREIQLNTDKQAREHECVKFSLFLILTAVHVTSCVSFCIYVYAVVIVTWNCSLRQSHFPLKLLYVRVVYLSNEHTFHYFCGVL